MTKKSYQKRLPTVLPPAPPAPRPAPAVESAPSEPEPDPDADRTAASVAVSAVAAAPAREPDAIPEARPQPGTAARTRRSGTGRIVAASLVGAVVVLVVAVRLASLLSGSDESPAADQDPDRTAVAGLARGESYVVARALPGGDIVVRQWVRPEEEIQMLGLAIPELPADVDMSARAIEVFADGEPVVGPSQLLGGVATYSLPSAQEVELRYRLAGVTEVSGSAEGRALAVATTLDVRYDPLVTRETRVVRASAVLSLACSRSSTESPVPCGEPDGAGRWTVELDGGHVTDRTVAQLTLD